MNDVRVQAGPKRFDEFMRDVERAIHGHEVIDATYMMRAWPARAPE